MKDKTKIIGIITMIMVLLFLITSCDIFKIDDPNVDNTNNKNGGESGNSILNITIKNNTTQTLNSGWVKPSTSTDWGTYFSPYINSGESKSITLPKPLSTNSVYDFRFGPNYGGGGYLGDTLFFKYNVSVSNGMILTLTNSDLSNGSNLPTITIQNRSGINFSSCYIKPSSASDWGYDFGSLSNNINKTVTIPIPPSNYTVFDIQMRTTDPTVPSTFTKTNVTVTNDMVVTFVSIDADGDNHNLPVIVIQNNTTQTLNSGWVKPSTSTDWGTYFSPYINSGESRSITLPKPLSANSVYDFRFSPNYGGGGYLGDTLFFKYNVSVSNGMTIILTNNDLQR